MPKMARNRSALHDVLAQGASNRDITVLGSILHNGCQRICTTLILGLHPANERQRYFVMMSLIGWAQT